MRASLVNKAGIANRALRAGRRNRGAAAMRRPIQTLLRARSAVRNRSRRDENRRHP